MENKNILVVEDNAMNMKLVRSLLQKGPYKILEATDAERGIQLAREHRPALILMDIQLPGMDGLSATRILKQDPGLQKIPIVALTAYAMDGDAEKAMEAGCNGYITKPFNIQGFWKTIDQFFQEGHERESLAKKDMTGKSRILIVDDEPLNVKLLAAKLPHDQYEIIQAYNGNEALEKAGQESLDLILLDIMMPGMDGFEVTRRLKNDPKTSEIPVIIVTALEGTEEKLKGLEAGADEFLNKPLNTVELLSRVQSLIRGKQYREQCLIHTQSEAIFKTPIHDQESAEEKTVVPSVLLVEDNPNDARLIQQYLNGSSFKIDLVSDGEKALAMAEKNPIDLILLDILLPGMDGFEVCRRLKERNRNIQIAMITCLSDLGSKVKGLEMGVDDFLLKPINPYELKIRVNALLKKKAYLDRLNGHYEPPFQAAIIDMLTGLYKPAYFKHFSELEMKRSLRQRHPLSLIMVDIDDFKQCKDTLGHLAGDSIRKEFGQLMKSNFREIDFPALYGEERVAILLPYTDGSRALQIAERVRLVINSHSFLQETAWPSQKLTVSMGVADSSENLPKLEELIRKADEALCMAKKEGKNRVCFHGSQLRAS